ncbi:PQQ-dependent sugar dehydrogenase [Brevibacillus choshinensis]|uniref:PQQ-dependent sugar dehydrogenase n=1 Tax=Brevibacillus choshinensis TaxID=54911 RepID=A0ABX7FQJ1_BRECH|nr:PQQ-dependent sugar dehydrogenase [Brevibacillus choshinensis]QRG68432.1 PQQ-dependent sugar dehydrogenase [Brevibacillus choshinensis]
MWKKWGISLLALALLVPAAACEATDTEGAAAQELPYVTEVVADHLDVPWAIDIAADGRIFFTERPGRVRVIQEGKLQAEPLIAFPAPFAAEGEGGLLGLVLDPKFAENHYLYVYHTYREGEKVFNRVLRMHEENNRAQVDKVLLDQVPGSGIHNGGRLKIGPDQLLYITAGDARIPELAQDRESLAGKILRIHLDGSLPADNPYPGSPVYSFGHRNPQGIAWHPANGLLYSSEHGQSAHDEINRIQKGENYGWPLIQGDQQKEGMIPPILHSGDTTWAPSGMSFVTSGPWAGQLLVANLRGMQLQKVKLDPQKPDSVLEATALLQGEYGRLRDVFAARDGSLYVLTNNRDGRGTPQENDDRIIRLAPRQP